MRKPDEKIATGTTRDSIAALVNSQNPWLSADVTSRMLSTVLVVENARSRDLAPVTDPDHQNALFVFTKLPLHTMGSRRAAILEKAGGVTSGAIHVSRAIRSKPASACSRSEWGFNLVIHRPRQASLRLSTQSCRPFRNQPERMIQTSRMPIDYGRHCRIASPCELLR